LSAATTTIIAAATAATAAYGAYDAHQQGSAARRAAQRGSTATQTNESTPWGPTVPLRQAGLDQALNLFNTNTPQFHPYRPGGGGPSREQRNIAQQIIQRGRNGTPLQHSAEQFAQGALTNPQMRNGQFQGVGNTHNPMLYQLWNEGAPENSYLTSFIERMMSEQSGAPKPGSREVGDLSSEKYLREILDGKYLNQGNPYADSLVDNISRKVRENYLESEVPEANAYANANGRFGSEAWQGLRTRAADKLQTNLGDIANEVLFGQYQFERGQQGSALNTLAGVDVAKMNEESQRYNADVATQDQGVARLLQALGMHSNDQQFGRSYLGSLAQQLSADRLGVLGMTPAINNMGLQGLQSAQQASQQISQQQAAARERQRQYDIQRWNFNQELPYNQLGQLGRFIDIFGGGYGTNVSTGTQQGGGAQGPSNFGSIMGGALQGGQLATDIAGMWQRYQQQQAARRVQQPPANPYGGMPPGMNGGA
jgi:hypothetical protein